MSETQAAPVTAPITEVVKDGAPVTPATKTEVVTLDQHNELKAELAKATAAINALQAQKRTEAKTEPAKVEKPESDPALAERVKAVEERETKQREVMRRNSVKAAALTKGIPDKHADRFARIVLAEHGDKVFVDEEYNVHYRDSETKTTPITDWVGAYLQTEDGQVFKPVKQAPNSDALRGGNETPPAASEFDGMTYTQVLNDSALAVRASKVPGLMDKLRAANEQKRRAKME